MSGKLSGEAVKPPWLCCPFREWYQPRGHRSGQQKNNVLKDMKAETDHRIIYVNIIDQRQSYIDLVLFL